MSVNEPMSVEGGESAEPTAEISTPRKRSSLLGGLRQSVRQFGRDVVSVALGRILEPPEKSLPAEQESTPPGDETSPAETDLRVRVLHAVAQRLRGATDTYIAAKLDEIEARVDQKLDHIETRINDKVLNLHRQLQEMRDRELRHRLRLLKVTLVFTVLVALLSLGYKWVVRYWIG